MSECIGGDGCECGCRGTEAKGEQPDCLSSEEGSSPSGPATLVAVTSSGVNVYAFWSNGQVYRGYPQSDAYGRPLMNWTRLDNVPRD